MVDFLNKFVISEFGAPSEAGVYMVCARPYFSYKERIVYVGSSKNIFKRLNNRGHVYRKLLDRSSNCIYTKTYVTDDYLQLEKDIISYLKPLLNKQHK